jgi:hypothetical protein
VNAEVNLTCEYIPKVGSTAILVCYFAIIVGRIFHTYSKEPGKSNWKSKTEVERSSSLGSNITLKGSNDGYSPEKQED